MKEIGKLIKISGKNKTAFLWKITWINPQKKKVQLIVQTPNFCGLLKKLSVSDEESVCPSDEEPVGPFEKKLLILFMMNKLSVLLLKKKNICADQEVVGLSEIVPTCSALRITSDTLRPTSGTLRPTSGILGPTDDRPTNNTLMPTEGQPIIY